MKVTILGCGASPGVPEIGCACAVCRSDNPKNKRLRVSVLVEAAGKQLLIDTSPDLRQQALRQGLRTLDAVLYTHDHADHTHGIDELRMFNYNADAAIPVYGDAHTLSLLNAKFPYAFQPRPDIWFRPALEPHEIRAPQAFHAAGVEVLPFLQEHGRTHTLGFRIGNFAYSTDTNGLSDAAFAALEGLDVWVVDCLRYTPSHTHSRLELTLEWITRARPKLAVLTHMAHQIDYDEILGKLPPGVVPAYDGMALYV